MEISQPTSPAASEPTTRRRVQLPRIQTTFVEKPQRLQRPRPVQTVLVENSNIALVEHAELGRRSSRLLGLFGRNNKSFKTARLDAPSKVVEGENEGTVNDATTVEGKTKKGADAAAVEKPYPAEDICVAPGAQQPLG